MRRPLRLALAVVGVALAVYAGASLTGGWLGTPPWWEVRERPAGTIVTQEDARDAPPRAPYRQRRREDGEVVAVLRDDEVLPRPGRELISASLGASALALALSMMAPRTRSRARVFLCAFGAATAVYGMASLTGGWLGEVPWWERVVPGNTLRERDWDPFQPPFSVEPRNGRVLISTSIIALGLALFAWAAWPRGRSRMEQPT